VQSVDAVGDALQLSLSHAGETRTLNADLVVQTAGLDTDVRRTDDRLISQLLTNAHISADPLGLGVKADTDGRLQHDGQHWPHLFAIGSLLRGTLWESTAMPEIRQQARHLADQLLSA
jgi:uncharacterized NAD(P)/FAD-binding protein YdhS